MGSVEWCLIGAAAILVAAVVVYLAVAAVRGVRRAMTERGFAALVLSAGVVVGATGVGYGAANIASHCHPQVPALRDDNKAVHPLLVADYERRLADRGVGAGVPQPVAVSIVTGCVATTMLCLVALAKLID